MSWQDVKGSMVIAGSYEVAVKMMGDMNFLTALLNFPKEQINDETVELVQVSCLLGELRRSCMFGLPGPFSFAKSVSHSQPFLLAVVPLLRSAISR